LTWQVPPQAIRPVGLILGWRYGLFTPGTSRVVIDVARPVALRKVQVLPPQGRFAYRFAVDLGEVDRASFLATLRQRASIGRRGKSAAKTAPLKPRAPGGRKVVVLDPGHGGVDPGTIGISGVYEKNVTLGFARELKRRLEKKGRLRVVMTRSRDVFVRLRRRVERGRRAQGDLFVSLHADAIKNRRVRGASVYTLSEKSSDKEAAALAAKENKADIIAGLDLGSEDQEVTNILIDLVQRETMNLSATFANLLLPEIKARARLLKNSHRFAGFAVLKAPDVPSVLVELGYLSNRQDERLLTSTRRRRALVEALAAGIERYFAKPRG
jgi:N-acetylmuramoyl-L-alanine amidase